MITDIGRHRVRHGDVTDGIADLMRGEKAELMYTDPPWGAGTIKMFATMNRKMTGQTVEPSSLERLLAAVFDIAEGYCTRFLVVEYGIKWRDVIQDCGVAAGFVPHGIFRTLYKGGKSGMLPMDQHVFARPGERIPDGYADLVTDSNGLETARRTVRAFAPLCRQSRAVPVLLDPCCGLGLFAQAARENGFTFRGNELNAARLAKTIERLRR